MQSVLEAGSKLLRRRKLIYLGGAILCAAVLIGLIFGLFVEDWSRDLTINFAETAQSPADFRLKNLELAASPALAAGRVEKAVAALPGWQAAPSNLPTASQTKPTPDAQKDASVQLAFVRTTRWMRYKDDVVVTLTPTPSGCLLSARSKSRVGKGDLGQNPRNLRELLSAVKKEFGLQ